MFSEIPISKINDFTFCPRSLYFHGVYEALNEGHYKATPQKRGTLKHTASDTGMYSSRKRYLQGMDVASQKYNLVGKIDIYDLETGTLVERKATIRHVFPGYRFQVMAQALCLEEMGYEIKNIFLHSLSDNKKYPIEFEEKDWKEFQKVLKSMQTFDLAKTEPITEIKKCAMCIYRTLCRGDVDFPKNPYWHACTLLD